MMKLLVVPFPYVFGNRLCRLIQASLRLYLLATFAWKTLGISSAYQALCAALSATTAYMRLGLGADKPEGVISAGSAGIQGLSRCYPAPQAAGSGTQS
ncbi:hypothetical protein [Niveibacterium microcysteis]|uniref:Uncharacterized protein n=1 Tax=Niveibacterium microcysteis TaxID=2811415 RepID=A0ABX7M0M5_9RHOO|nr:hypothetical protein [Niveibacterium microcysteis]QSI75309.1 hypothetical protein JY500_12365 [Niveibacterium microcysteis]